MDDFFDLLHTVSQKDVFRQGVVGSKAKSCNVICRFS